VTVTHAQESGTRNLRAPNRTQLDLVQVSGTKFLGMCHSRNETLRVAEQPELLVRINCRNIWRRRKHYVHRGP